MAWTDQRVTDLRRLWAEGLSASQIAFRLGGCTRSAVLGKVHRLGLPGRATTSRMRSHRPRRPRAASSSPRRAPPRPGQPRTPKSPNKDRGFEAAPLPDAEVKATVLGVAAEDLGINRRSLAELERSDCRWPIGDPRHADFGFCGATALQGRPYCSMHSARAWQRDA
jgi:GcrA cell cycle regulator